MSEIQQQYITGELQKFENSLQKSNLEALITRFELFYKAYILEFKLNIPEGVVRNDIKNLRYIASKTGVRDDILFLMNKLSMEVKKL